MSSKLRPNKGKKKTEANEKQLSPEDFGFAKLGENASFLQKLLMFEVALINKAGILGVLTPR